MGEGAERPRHIRAANIVHNDSYPRRMDSLSPKPTSEELVAAFVQSTILVDDGGDLGP